MPTRLRRYDEPDYEFGDESVLKMDWDGSCPIIW